MNLSRLCMTLLLVAASAAPSLGSGEIASREHILVSPAWVHEHLRDHDLVILMVAQNGRLFRNAHIPGSRFLWPGSVAASTPELSTELVPLAQLDTLMSGLGITKDSRVVLCGIGGNVSSVARVFVTLEYLGLKGRTMILDGGFEAWQAAGFPASTETLAGVRSGFTPQVDQDAIIGIDYLLRRKNAPGVVLVDARAPEFYSGARSGGSRAGHIPGARNLFYTTLYDSSDRFSPSDTLMARFKGSGIGPGRELIVYCHVGQTASSVYVAARILGYTVHLFDGSFEEWSAREELPIELTPASTANQH